ncbi:MAG: uncharacterized protein QOE61_1593, partial [Micromonosporaceae bacterium]|nr:uncharacterized protein [Micromonosporaceae bacterium]
LELPRETRIPGPGQAQQTMATDGDAISRINLLKGQGTQAQVVYGNLLSLPYGGGLLYVQPVYVKSANVNPFPLMRLVLVSYGSLVGFDTTLQGAINALVKKAGETTTGAGPPPGGTQTPPNTPPAQNAEVAAAAAKIDAAITRLHDTQAKGDFAGYGAALGELDAAVKEFQAAQAKATGTAPAPAPSGSPTG